MATNAIEYTKELEEDEMKTLATEQQQCFYEELNICCKYNIDEHKYLKQNIGYAIYGPPKSFSDVKNADEKASSCYYKTENKSTVNLNDTDAINEICYDDEAKTNIDKIYNKICELTTKNDPSEPIYYGIVYNVIYPIEITIKPEKEEKDETTKIQTETKNNKSKKTEEKKMLVVLPVCVFKVQKCIEKNLKTTKKNEKQNNTTSTEVQNDVWYIDTNARVYTNWTDYIENNTLPKCTMVFPKDGIYQADRNFPIMEDYSTVWLETKKSPACSWTKVLCDAGDVASTVVGFGATGLAVASMFTPIGPVVAMSSFIAAGVSGTWSIGRNTQQLIDRGTHEESINPLDKEAFPHYIGIAASVVGLGAMGGSMIISTVAARGMTVNTAARVAFNTVQGGNIIINGFGVIYQGYNMINKYMSNEQITVGETLNFATHLLFFCGSVIKVQFASDIIENSQGKVMREYKESLSTRRLRKNFNRAMRRAANNNECKMSENAEVIRYIRNREELLQSQLVNGNNRQLLNNDLRNITWSFDQGKIKINGILLLDPLEYVTQLLKKGIFIPETNQNSSFKPCNFSNDSNFEQLNNVLIELLSRFYLSNDCPKSTNIPLLPDFEELIRELNFLNMNEEYLKKLFEIAVKLMKRSKDCEDFLAQILIFVWQYCKANLRQWGMSVSHSLGSVSGSTVLKKIINAVFEAIDMITNNLASAFQEYKNCSRIHNMYI